MVEEPEDYGDRKKKTRLTDRPYSTALYHLRCCQLGMHLNDLDQITYGMVVDMMTESGNDGEHYNIVATQEDFDRF